MGEVCLNQMKKLSNGTEELQNKDMIMPKITLDVCIRKVKACLNQMKKLSNGTEKLLNRDMLMHKIILEICIITGKAYLSHMKKHINGSRKPLIKDMKARRHPLVCFIKRMKFLTGMDGYSSVLPAM
uniref:Uncharacterized protein n=1 Tax=Plectus sambesii TaxID=2011161 RepID=A0A914X8T9_9BILA